MNTAWFYVHLWCSALADKTTRSVELYWPPDLLRPMITSFSAWKIHYDINESKMEVAIIFWNFHSQLGFVVKKVEDVREKGESLKWACARRSCRKGAKMSKVFFRKNFCVAKTLSYLCEEWKDNCWSDVCIVYEQILQNGKLFTQSRNVLIGLEIADGIMLHFVLTIDRNS